MGLECGGGCLSAQKGARAWEWCLCTIPGGNPRTWKQCPDFSSGTNKKAPVKFQ